VELSKEKQIDETLPMVSIGMPIFNSEATLRLAIDSILKQSYTEFELIISDNCSTDSTSEICREYEKIDSRIFYIRQAENIGATKNFEFVFNQGRGKYFLWAAGDDERSFDFLEVNIKFLEAHSGYIASTSPNCFASEETQGHGFVSFDIVGSVEERFIKFFDNCWQSHGIFYSVFRREVLINCEILGSSFMAADWAINLCLIKHGNVHRSVNGLTTFGVNGVSRGADAWGIFRNGFVEWVVPFKSLTAYVFKLSADLPFPIRYRIIKRLLKLNLSVSYRPLYAIIYPVLYPIYRRYVRQNLRSSSYK
jgi:glycosyltransferase involved in cell wall biosynthesis